jgi:hypothetical protein
VSGLESGPSFRGRVLFFGEVLDMFINNSDAGQILDFLEKNGPAPYEALLALAICHGWNRDGKKVRAMHRLGVALKKLALSRSAYRVELGGREFWLPDGYTKAKGRIYPDKQGAAALQAVREEELAGRRKELVALLSEQLEKAGGYLANGVATFDGASYPVKFNLQKEIFYLGDQFYFSLSDLKDQNKPFKSCLLPLDRQAIP